MWQAIKDLGFWFLVTAGIPYLAWAHIVIREDRSKKKARRLEIQAALLANQRHKEEDQLRENLHSNNQCQAHRSERLDRNPLKSQ